MAQAQETKYTGGDWDRYAVVLVLPRWTQYGNLFFDTLAEAREYSKAKIAAHDCASVEICQHNQVVEKWSR